MSRWIDADTIEKKYGITEDCKGCKALGKNGSCLAWCDAVENAPSIDLVRCAECKHNYNTAINHGKMNPRCDFMDAKLNADDFCSYGERKESE